MMKGKSLFLWMFMIFIIFIGSSSVYAQGLTVGNGTVYNLGDAAMNMNCQDVIEGGGTLNLQSGTLQDVRNLTIQSGGVLNGGSALIIMNGKWTNNGTFNPGTSTVEFTKVCGETNEVQGTGDSDGDGIPDNVEGNKDCDGNGIPNFLDPDPCRSSTVPTMNVWGLMIIAGLTALVGKLTLRRRLRV